MRHALVFVFLLVFLFPVIQAQACSSNGECDDSNPQTTDLCVRPGAEDAGCTNLACTPACSSNSDCNDNDPATSDVCAGAGRCTAECSNLSTCGNGVIDAGENSCNCPKDAGTCSGSSLGTCSEYACIGDSCQQTISLGCCGNRICELKENYATCSADCKPKNVEIEVIGVDESTFFVRGEEVLIKVRISADGAQIKNAFVDAEGFFGKLKLFNDGKHSDGINGDDIYANSFTVPLEIQADTFPVAINALFDDSRGIKDFNFVVLPALDIKISTGAEEYSLGESIDVTGIVSRKGTGISSNVLLTVYSNEIKTLEREIATNQLGEFSFSYRTSFLENAGPWRIGAFSQDESGNSGLKEKTITVSDSKITSYLSFEVLQEIREKYNRGETVKLSLKLVKGTEETVTGAEVTAITPDNQSVALAEKEGGIYEGEIFIGVGFPFGEQEIRVNALKKENENSFFAGTANIPLNVQKVDLLVEIVEPRRFSFQVGEELEFLARVFYPDKKPVVASKINASVNGRPFELQQVAKGVYSGKYIVQESDGPAISFLMDVDDGFENLGASEIELEVSGVSFLHYLRKYFYSIVLLVLALAIGIAVFALKTGEKRRLSSFEREKKLAIDKIKDLQRQYFRDGVLDKKNYDKLMEKTQAELEYTNKSIEQAKERQKNK